MQINLEALTATYKKSSFIPGIIFLNSEGPTIEIWLSTRDFFNSRREIKPGCHLTCTDVQYTILEVDTEAVIPRTEFLHWTEIFLKRNTMATT